MINHKYGEFHRHLALLHISVCVRWHVMVAALLHGSAFRVLHSNESPRTTFNRLPEMTQGIILLQRPQEMEMWLLAQRQLVPIDGTNTCIKQTWLFYNMVKLG